MGFFRVLGIIFYAAVLILVGVGLIIVSLNMVYPDRISDFLFYLQDTGHLRVIAFLAGCLLILISVSFAQAILGKFQSEKTYAFSTASGEVTISLSAIEDLIRHFVVILPEIKELKPDVITTRKGNIVVNLKVTLRSEANLPELTARLQEITKTKVQEVLGLEEQQVLIRIHIAKIISREEKDRKRREIEKEEPPIPFGGYGRI